MFFKSSFDLSLEEFKSKLAEEGGTRGGLPHANGMCGRYVA